MIHPHAFGYESSSRPMTSGTPSGAADASDLRYLEERVDRLSLICMAMWSLMQDKASLTEEDLIERVKLIDL
ncbi:MAG: hypothetical protein ACPGYV_10360, partial [Phycisphaeraceae bacterium]